VNSEYTAATLSLGGIGNAMRASFCRIVRFRRVRGKVVSRGPFPPLTLFRQRVRRFAPYCGARWLKMHRADVPRSHEKKQFSTDIALSAEFCGP